MTTLIIIAAASVILGFFINFIITRYPKLKLMFQIVLPVAIITLGYFLYKGIETPIKFNKQLGKRTEVVVKNLIDIRTAQSFYKSVYGKYAGNFDALINFYKNDSITVVRAVGSISDSLLNLGMTETEAISKGIIIREKSKVAVKDTIFDKGFAIDSLKYIPFSHGVEFEIGSGEIVTGSNVKVQVFEARAPYNIFLKGLDKQLIINLIDEKKVNKLYPGLKVGSLEEANNNAGNWE